MEITLKVKMTDEEFKNIMEDDGYEEIETGDYSISKYARFFDESSETWTRDPEKNLVFLNNQRRNADDLLKMRGYLYLNEVYRMLGLSKIESFDNIGWIYDKDNPIGDNYVDFGILKQYNMDFVNGFRNSMLIDPNVDGDISKYVEQ